MHRYFLVLCIIFSCTSGKDEPPYFAQGVKIGEVSQESAVMHVRLTAYPVRSADPGGWPTTGDQTGWGPDPGFVGDCPGGRGQVRMVYDSDSLFLSAERTPWISVDSTTDYVHQFFVNGLQPDTRYYYRPESMSQTTGRIRQGMTGSFRTAPSPDVWKSVTFTVITCQASRSRDREDGFNTYVSMKKISPDFLVHTGDNVYYDSDPPVAKTPAVARFHWRRMYSFPTVVDFFRISAVYFEKDDHDYRWDDADPYRRFPGISHEDGIAIYTEQVPMSEKPYRSFRWGKGLEIWLVEGRDFRSNNEMPDGPEKSIWGIEQKTWLKKGIAESDAAFKILLSPTPLVGPDRPTKRDNHTNPEGYLTEGREFLEWAGDNTDGDFFICCGDRHWQYHSIDNTGIMEFDCGPVTDKHVGGLQPTPNSAPRASLEKQPYYRLGGGFLSVETAQEESGRPIIHFRFHDVHGDVLYTWSHIKNS